MKSFISFENPCSGEIHGEFTWCLHCQCVYKTESWVTNNWDCPEKSCDGDILDAFPWVPEYSPLSGNPDYPLNPIEGKRYPMEGENKIL